MPASDVQLVFSKESRRKTSATVRDKCQIQLKKRTSVREIIYEFFFFFYFSILSFLNFAMTKWFCRVICFVKIVLFYVLSIKSCFIIQFKHQVRCYQYSIVKIIAESVSLGRKVLLP